MQPTRPYTSPIPARPHLRPPQVGSSLSSPLPAPPSHAAQRPLHSARSATSPSPSAQSYIPLPFFTSVRDTSTSSPSMSPIFFQRPNLQVHQSSSPYRSVCSLQYSEMEIAFSRKFTAHSRPLSGPGAGKLKRCSEGDSVWMRTRTYARILRRSSHRLRQHSTNEQVR